MPIEALALVGALGSAMAHLAFKKAVGSGAPRALLAVRWGTGAVAMTGGLLFTTGWGAYAPSWPLFWLVVGAVAGPVVGWLLYLRALPHLDVSVAQPIFNSSVAVAMVLAVLFLGERPNAFTWLGAALILAGVQLLQQTSLRPDKRPAPTAGAALGTAVSAPRRLSIPRWLNPHVVPALGSAVFFGFASFCFKLGLTDLTPVETNWVRTMVPTLVLLALTATGEWRLAMGERAPRGPLLTRRGMVLAVAAGLANDVLGWIARLVALKGGPLTIVEPLAATSPLFVAILGGWLLGERLGPRGWLGVGVTVLGAMLLGGLGR